MKNYMAVSVDWESFLVVGVLAIRAPPFGSIFRPRICWKLPFTGVCVHLFILVRCDQGHGLAYY